MASKPLMTTEERAERHKRIVAAYAHLSARAVAERFGLSPTHVKRIVSLYGVSRRVGRPRAR